METKSTNVAMMDPISMVFSLKNLELNIKDCVKRIVTFMFS